MPIQTEEVPPLTYRLLEVAGDAERAAYLFQLLEGEATARQLRELPTKDEPANKYLRRPVSQPTGARHLTRLGDIGVADDGREAQKYRLTCPQETRAFLEAANRLALAIGRSGTTGDEEIDRGLRQARVRPAKNEVDETSGFHGY